MAEKGTVQETAVVGRWYFGGLASAGAACCTHPLDLLKVHLQTAQTKGGGSATKMAVTIVRTQGIRALYNGISASIGRQRYDVPIIGDCASGVAFQDHCFIGVFENITRNIQCYKHVFDGAFRVYKEEGFVKLFRGAEMATFRAILMTVGQIAFYDQSKQLLISWGVIKDNMIGHFTASTIAGTIATALTQPFDVLKTRLMNAKPGEFRGIGHCIMVTAKLGPMAFYKGFVPAFVRLAPHTILTFIFFEQLRKNFGYTVVLTRRED
ncbi:mitochondrial dicarboxylate carrier-like [Saccoglossus kowalevskii]|uniref:Mitochondrial dicarboxylate carrier-like n=1 Tax=Saccoglossus kowalevskii TaxID=10224 RepID=A0ABM0MW53_SACKO|nr:PREDICTED: mitochondrial dicarboxylate carrier-like [Saccoglossus kowalevskii]